MPKVVLKIETDKLPALYAARNVDTLAELNRLFREAQAVISKAVKVFPDAAEFKVLHVTVKPAEPKQKQAQATDQTARTATA